jgi:SnoaL-like domain
MTKQLSNQKAEAKSDVKGASPAFSVASQRSRADDLAVLARNEKFIREAYRLAEIKDIPGWVACFNDDGTFTNEAAGITYRGPNEVGRPVEIFAQAFPDMHRELYNVYATGDIVVVELSLNGTSLLFATVDGFNSGRWPVITCSAYRRVGSNESQVPGHCLDHFG